MNKYRELFEKYVAEVGRAPHALTRIWVLGFCDWLARNESGLTPRALDGLERVALHCTCPDDADHPDCPVHGTSRQ
jgi:hypothetical protein